MKRFSVKKLPMALFSAFFVKCVIMPASFPDSLVLAVLAVVTCFYEFKNNEKKLQLLEARIVSAEKTFTDKESEIQKIRDTVNSLKIGSIARPANVQR